MKEKIIDYIERLEAKAMQSDEYFKQRIELYIENQKLKSRIEKAVELIKDLGCFDNMCNYFCDDLSPNELTELLNILNGKE